MWNMHRFFRVFDNVYTRRVGGCLLRSVSSSACRNMVPCVIPKQSFGRCLLRSALGSSSKIYGLPSLVPKRRVSTSDSRNVTPCALPKPEYGPVDVYRSDFLNGIKVACAKPNGAQLATCTLMFSVGSRCEIDEELGLTHFLRVGSTLSGCTSSRFIRCRVLSQNGAYITVKSDRQTILYTLRCQMHVFPEVKSYLLDVGLRNFFCSWEINDIKDIVLNELLVIPPQQRTLDLVQKAAWTGGLANSIFCQKERVDNITNELMDKFVDRYYQTSACAIASNGIPYDDILKLATQLDLGKTTCPKPTKFPKMSCFRPGFNTYDLGKDAETYVAMAVPGSGTCSFQCLIAHAILANVLSSEHMVNFQHCELPTPPSQMLAHGIPNADFKTFNISYWETGLFGILVRAPASTIRLAAMRGQTFLRNLCQIDCRTIEQARKRLKVALFAHDEEGSQLTEGLVQQIANGLKFDHAGQFSDAIDSVAAGTVQEVATKISQQASAMAIAVVGDVANGPIDAELRTF